jgi:hypothetical protein
VGKLAVVAAAAASALALTACAGGEANNGSTKPEQLQLGGPNTHIRVVIPSGWHQVIDSANPAIPEMVTPTSCMGNGEVSCATGLARLASLTAPNVQAAEAQVEKAVLSSRGVKLGQSISSGPGKVGRHDGYLHRFTFSNSARTLTCEIAAVPSGPAPPDARGNHEYSIVLVWVLNAPNAPKPEVIDQIIGSATVTGGQPAG